MKRSQEPLPAAPSGLRDDSERRILSRKEQAREQRHALYQQAKERRATDPRHLAMKEAAKERRRAAYQQVKEQRNVAAAAEKARRKAGRAAQRSEERATSDRVLAKLVTARAAERSAESVESVESDRELALLGPWMTKGSNAQN